MQDRPHSPSATVARQYDAVSALPQDFSVVLRRALLWLNAVGLLGGYFVLYNAWTQMMWCGIVTVTWLAAGGHHELTEGLRRDRWLVAVFGLLFLLLVRSSILDSPGMSIKDLWLGWFRSGALLPTLLILWLVARTPHLTVRLGAPMVLLACIAAVVSMAVFYRLDPNAMFGTRLRNWFVYGGLNSVCTGMTFGFASVWAGCCWVKAEKRSERRLWLAALLILQAATLFTLSRGALFALVAGHMALWVICGWRRAWRQLVVLALMVGLFQAGGPVLRNIAAKDAAAKFGIADLGEASAALADGVVATNPMRAMVERADNGRFEIFEAAFHSMTTWQDWVFGKGLWSSNDFWSCSLHWYPEHLHSVFMDALVRGGLSALLGLVGLLVWGLWRAILLARRGEEIWLMLASFGCFALMFDGDSAFGLLTVPRYEPLLIWVPLVMASARFVGDGRAFGRTTAR